MTSSSRLLFAIHSAAASPVDDGDSSSDDGDVTIKYIGRGDGSDIRSSDGKGDNRSGDGGADSGGCGGAMKCVTPQT